MEIYLLTVRSVDSVDAISQQNEPLKFVIRATAADEGGAVRNVFFSFFEPEPSRRQAVGWVGESSNSIAIFLAQQDFPGYVLLLEQLKAARIEVRAAENGEITSFVLSTTSPSSTTAKRKLAELVAQATASCETKS